MKRLVVLSGAGISAESGVRTFRDAGGLWEGHDIMEVASPEGWRSDPGVVLDFYNARRRQLKQVAPNSAHEILKELEQDFEVFVITQNVDDLHERAGSTRVLHLHGELLKVRSEADENSVYDWTEDLHLGDLAEDGAQLRPHIVWFGEAVPMLERAAELGAQADIFLVIGTSMQVYPAASLVEYVPAGNPIFVIDLQKPAMQRGGDVHFIQATASEGMRQLREILLKEFV